MTSMTLVPGDPMSVPFILKESFPSLIGVWCGVFLVLAILFFLLWRLMGKAWFWCWDRYIEQHRPTLVFRNNRDPSLDRALPIFGGCRFSFSKTLFGLDSMEDWIPGFFKVKRRITFGKEVPISGRYRLKKGKNSITFNLDSKRTSEHRIKGLTDDLRDDFVFVIERNPLKKEST